MTFGSELIYSCSKVIPSTEFSKLLLKYFSSSFELLKYFTPSPLPPLLCFVINGLVNFLDFSIISFLFFA